MRCWPLKGARGLLCVLNWKLHCVFIELKSAAFHQKSWSYFVDKIKKCAYVSCFRSKCSVTKGDCRFGRRFDLSCQHVLVCKKCGKMRCSKKREVFVSRNVGVRVENANPTSPPLNSAAALLQWSCSNLRKRLRSFHLFLFRVLQLHLSPLCSTLDSQCQCL